MAKNNNAKDFVIGIAETIRRKKGITELIDPQDFEDEILTIQTGVDTSDATATADDIRLRKTAYGATGKIIGAIVDYDGTSEPVSGESLAMRIIDRSITELSEEDLKGVKTIGHCAFNGCENLVNITIPNSVTTIRVAAFTGCIGLTSITIPGSVTNIMSSVFQMCRQLSLVKLLPTIPPTLGSSVFDSDSHFQIIVPKGTLDAYKSATNWSAYADKIVEASE